MVKGVLSTFTTDLMSSDDLSFPACTQPYTESDDSPMRTKAKVILGSKLIELQ